MLTSMDASLASKYKSAAQCARVVSESWAEANLYCVVCNSNRLSALPRNSKVNDFQCPTCSAFFQLKSSRCPFGTRIVDGAYESFAAAIRNGQTPNLLALRYSQTWAVVDLFVVPNFALTLSCLEKRIPLSPDAQRAGWIGCNLLLSNIPPDARISIVDNQIVVPPATVRKRYGRIGEVARLEHHQRGWVLDVLHTVRRIGRTEFALSDVYADAKRLARLHPDNRHIEAKIRQQLQKLRDMGLISFLSRGKYEVVGE